MRIGTSRWAHTVSRPLLKAMAERGPYKLRNRPNVIGHD